MPGRIASLAVSAILVLCVAFPPEAHHPWARAACQVAAAAAFVSVVFTGRAASLPIAGLSLLPFAVASVLAAHARAAALDEACDALLLLLAGFLGWRCAAGAFRRLPLVALIAAGTGAAADAIIQRHLAWPIVAETLRSSPAASGAVLAFLRSGRPTGPFILPAALGGFLALSLPPSIGAALRSPGRAIRVMASAASVLQLYALFLSRSIGAVAAVGAGLLLALPALRPRRRALWVIVVVLLATLGSGYFLLARNLERAAAQGLDPLSLRLGNWRAAIRMIGDHPLLGTGPGTFADFYPRLMRPGMNETRYAHQSYLQAAAGWGLWIAAPLGALILAFARATQRSVEPDPERYALLAAGGSFLVHNAGDFTAFLPGVAVPAAILLGMALRRREDPPGERPGGRRLAALAAVLACACLYAFHAQVRARADSLLDSARAAAEAGEPDRALDLARRAGAARPGDPAPAAFQAQLILAERRDDPILFREGERAAERALRADPDQAILHYTRALYHEAAGEIGPACRERLAAHRLYPLKELYGTPAGVCGPPADGSR